MIIDVQERGRQWQDLDALIMADYGDYALYGFGAFVPPGGNLLQYYDAVRRGTLTAIVGLCIPVYSASAWPDNLRELTGQILRLAPVVYVWDCCSIEMALHFGINARMGEHPAWLAPPQSATESIVTTPEDAIAAAVAQNPFLLRVPVEPGQGSFRAGAAHPNHPLVRWAEKYACLDAVVVGDAEQPLPAACPVTPGRVQQAQNEARRTLDKILAPAKEPVQGPSASVAERLSAALSGKPIKGPAAQPRRMALGSKFDPDTHYTAHYYDERGIEYMRPDGTWDVYHGTGETWEGFDHVLDALRKMGVVRQTVLDVGCSTGDFVRRACQRGLDAWGIDLSKEAIGRSKKPDRLFVGNVCSPPEELLALGQMDLVTAWDLLEHIFLPDVPELLRGIYEIVAPGGYFAACVCTRGTGESDWTFSLGEAATKENSCVLVSGHVTIRPWHWWAAQLRGAGFKVHWGLQGAWSVWWASHPTMSKAASWGPRNFIIGQKVEAV